ncbi:EamA family transporter [Flavobacterium cerinum]|uniref:DMT family transporter n=1 Tax=Flavobacterium cerinum TaxID=2502784 RepID=A0ABY5IQU9_9FLAO|nr:DMT family transporter [Flavobacterium cerinum]UUC45226.1 DMT family transporter [Flavobacterium cerinum]
MLPKKKIGISAIPAVLLSMISIQSGASLAKQLFPVLGISGVATLRIGMSAIVLFGFFRPDFRNLKQKELLLGLGYGACLGAMNLIFYFAIQRIPLGLGVTLEFLGPLVLALMGSRKAIDLIWALLAGLGIFLITPRGDSSADMWGIVLAILAGAFWAGYIVIGGKISKVMKSGDAVTLGMLFASLFVIPIGVLSGDLYILNGNLLLLGLAVALLTSAIPFSLDMGALRQLPSKTFSILMSLHPAFAALSGLIFLNEQLNLIQGIAIGCVIAASIGATLTVKK